MRKLLSMMIFMTATTAMSGFVQAQESPLQTQLKKMQSGEAYGMKTASPTPPKMSSAEAQLNDNAKALTNRAMAQSQPDKKEPTRLEKMQEAYKTAEGPKPVPAHDEIAPGDKPVTKAQKTEDDDSDKTPIEKSVEKTEKAAADAQKLRDAQMLYEGINSDQPKKPPRLIPVD